MKPSLLVQACVHTHCLPGQTLGGLNADLLTPKLVTGEKSWDELVSGTQTNQPIYDLDGRNWPWQTGRQADRTSSCPEHITPARYCHVTTRFCHITLLSRHVTVTSCYCHVTDVMQQSGHNFIPVLHSLTPFE